jgi:hypothetical protein
MKGILMKYYVILSLIVFSLQGFSKITPPKIDLKEVFIKLKEFNDPTITRNLETDFFKNIRFQNDSLAYYNPDGTLHLFKIKFDSTVSVEKLSKGIYHGSTFNRYLFINQNKLYSFGGEGLWASCSKLLEFNIKNREWFKIEIKNYPFNASKIISSWIINNKLNVLLYLNGNNKSKKFNFIFGEIDMASFSFRKIGEFSSMYSPDLSFGNKNIIGESNRYIIYENSNLEKCIYGIFDKKTGERLFTNLLKDIPCIDGISYAYLQDSTLFYRSSSNELNSVLINESSVYDIYPMKEIYYDRILENRIYEISAYAIGFIILCVLIVLLIKKINLNSYSTNENTFEIEKRLLINKGSTIKREELDELLGISHLSFDSIKSKRSSIIRTINDNGRLKIERIRKEDDKRFFKYSIN